MKIARRATVGSAVVVVFLAGWVWGATSAADARPVVLKGTVSSDTEGPMEGVLIKAKQVGGTITISVVSDNLGRYAFPADLLKPGEYALAVRATGYDLPKSTVTVGDHTVTADLKLRKVSLFMKANQLNPQEWIMSAPSSGKGSISIAGCSSCHNSDVVFRSTYDTDEWMPTILRMRNYERGATFTHPTLDPHHSGQQADDAELAAYLASINLSAKPSWDFELKSFPRPKGRETKVIYTEFDLPRTDAEPHDAIIDPDGIIWYDDFNRPIFGRLDPRTGETKEWELPVMRPEAPPGSLNLTMDPKGNFWIARKYQAGVVEFDKKTEKLTAYSVPKEYINEYTLTTFVSAGPDGNVCFDDTQNHRIYFLNPTTGKLVGYDAYPGVPREKAPTMYGVSASSKGLCYWSELEGTAIGEIDPATGKINMYPTPTPTSGPRRQNITADDQIWFGENNPSAQKIAVFDTKTKQFKEWEDRPIDPHDAILDKSGHVWTGGQPTDFVTRLDPNTGEKVHYLLPDVNVDIRRVYVDNLTDPPSMLVGENHRHKILLVQPLE